ncbi:4-oxalocrotonate tautomerase family protein [Prolixibacteraceae bacterium]|nr:4-oxalocrotonate tautomerase family protein [Prolixibacteraceae bacterium]
MPTIQYSGASLTIEQKQELIEEFTKVVHRVTHAPDPFISVIIQEFAEENMGVGGKTISQIKAELKK